jgi:hypothetical protein
VEIASHPRKRVKAFRLDEGVIGMLALSARRHGTSENALVEKILTSILTIDPLVEAFGIMVFGREITKGLIEMADAENLEKFALTHGRRSFTLARSLFESNGMTLTYNEFVTGILGNAARWFRVEGEFAKPEVITLFHSCGMKWSLFLNGYLSGAWEIVSRDKLKIEITGEFITITFPKSSVVHG